MKKFTLLMVLATVVLFTTALCFTSCSDDDDTFALLGYWQCKGIGANVLGQSTNAIGEDVLKYFSIGYIGGKSGYYVRVGGDDLSSLASLTNISSTTWRDFLSTGSYVCDTEAGTITHTSNGEVMTYKYSLGNDKKSLSLIDETYSLPSGANSILDILNSLLGTDATSTVGVEYSYGKMSGKEAFDSLISSDK